MTQEDKNLLFKDLCGRLPYNLRLESKQLYGGILSNITKTGDLNARITITCGGALHANNIVFPLSSIKEHLPYLRPMSSMTKEEENMLDSMCNGVEMVSRLSGLKMFDKAFDWLYSKHFDIHGLIEKGLALEAPEGMYKTE